MQITWHAANISLLTASAWLSSFLLWCPRSACSCLRRDISSYKLASEIVLRSSMRFSSAVSTMVESETKLILYSPWQCYYYHLIQKRRIQIRSLVKFMHSSLRYRIWTRGSNRTFRTFIKLIESEPSNLCTPRSDIEPRSEEAIWPLILLIASVCCDFTNSRLTFIWPGILSPLTILSITSTYVP
jgi:hypothetical protein